MKSDPGVTTDGVEPAEELPFEPVYPFNEPGQEIRLHTGRLTLAPDCGAAGVVWMSCGSKFVVRWKVDGDVPESWATRLVGAAPVSFGLSRPGGDVEVTGRLRTFHDGKLNGSTLGPADALLSHVVVHWMNLPDLRRGRGRWQFSIGEWELILKPRPDHERVWDELDFDPRIAMTHVMSIARRDGEPFVADTVRVLLRALHFGVSFAFGRWIPPALPVGFSTAGSAVWEQWGPLFCDPGCNGAMSWMNYERADDLPTLIAGVLTAFSDPQTEDIARHLLARAVEANHTGRVEQRILTAFPALEWLCRVELKLSGKISGKSYKGMPVAEQIEKLLTDAGLPVDVDPDVQPALTAFALAESDTTEPVSGPQALTWVRNRLVHAKSPYDEVYEIENLLVESWFLTRHYLILLLLKWLGYVGGYEANLGAGRARVRSVPWTHQAKESD